MNPYKEETFYVVNIPAHIYSGMYMQTSFSFDSASEAFAFSDKLNIAFTQRLLDILEDSEELQFLGKIENGDGYMEAESYVVMHHKKIITREDVMPSLVKEGVKDILGESL